jgi:hypothetical protein
VGARTTPCPNCGGPIEFRLGSSAAVVCAHCRFAVVRTDYDLRTLGRVADLVPTVPPLAIEDEGTVVGRRFRVLGRLQLDQGKGPWDEFYVEFDDGTWGWLARAQGTWFVTALATLPNTPFPPWNTLVPGAPVDFGVGATHIVAERGVSRVLSAEGELPFALTPSAQSAFVDLSGPNGSFATLDIDETSTRLYLGRYLSHDQVSITLTNAGPRPEQRVSASLLRCPSCGGDITIHVPDRTERVVCGYCSTALDYTSGALDIYQRVERARQAPEIPLGTTGELDGERIIVIGFMGRFCVVDGDTYRWNEYLLHGPSGYSFLVEDCGHFTLVRSINAADAQKQLNEGAFRLFSSVVANVEFVIGEFYWKVEVGEQAVTRDFIAPPNILSEERSRDEVVWSLGRYIPSNELWKSLGLSNSPPIQVGVAPAQPCPHHPRLSLTISLLAVVALIVLSLGLSPRTQVLFSMPISIPESAAAAGLPPPVFDPYASRTRNAQPLGDHATYSPTFDIPSPTTLAIDLDTTVDNGWIGVECALINETTGEVREFAVDAEYFHGTDGGESWSEGNRKGQSYLGAVLPGQYTIRFEPSYESGTLAHTSTRAAHPSASILVTAGKRGLESFLVSLLGLLIPFGITVARWRSFEKKRAENSNV